MRRVLFSLFFLIVGLTMSCATNATYKPRTAIVGYTDRHIFDNKYEITFRGGTSTDMAQVWEWAYRRAAEVTIDNGYTYFAVTSEEETYESANTVLGDEWDETIRRSSGGYVKGSYVIGDSFPMVKLSIKCYKEEPKNAEVNNAVDYLNSHPLVCVFLCKL